MKFIDLTHRLNSNIPQWDIGCGFQSHVTLDYKDCHEEPKFRAQEFQMRAGIGTHMDAPAHCIPNGDSIADIALEQLIVSCVVIDVSAKAHETYRISTEDVIAFEKKHGIIADQNFIIFYTGWSQYWDQPDRYRNDLVFPSVAPNAVELLLQRNIVGLGIDTLSPDCPSSGFPVHQKILGSGKYIIENIANAHLLPPISTQLFALPLKIEGATESPIRLVAVV